MILYKNIAFVYLKIFSTFTNHVKPDELQHFAAFYLGLHCLKNICLGVSQIQRVKSYMHSYPIEYV